MNRQKLSRLNADDATARLYFAAFATRRRSFTKTFLSDVIDLARRQRILLSPANVETFFAGLEDADCGQFINDEEDAHFLWGEKAVNVARAAQKPPENATAPETVAPAAATVVHTLRLRADWTLQLELPPDFTRAEAARVAHFVAALPLEPTMELLIPALEASE